MGASVGKTQVESVFDEIHRPAIRLKQGTVCDLPDELKLNKPIDH